MFGIVEERDSFLFAAPQNTSPCLLVNFESQIYLDTVCHLLTSCQEPGQALCTRNISQGCLCQEEGSWVDISDVSNGADSTVDPVVHHPINLGSNSIFCENLFEKITALEKGEITHPLPRKGNIPTTPTPLS